MSSTPSPTVQIRICIERLKQGDESARGELLEAACERLMRLTRKIKGDYAGVGRWEQTEDVFQSACLRLYESLARLQPTDARHFFRLAAVQIRRELIDLARRYHGPHGLGARHATRLRSEPGQSRTPDRLEAVEATQDPTKLAEWADFHETIDTLPEPEREVFDLLWYHGLSQDEAAEVLEVDVRTIKRRWRAARLSLHAALGGELPGG
jgi:RNA polymerase sigma-70 factor (ECF subfamily)